MKTSKNIFLVIAIIALLFAQLASPMTVHADGGTEPPTTATPEVTPTPDPTEPVVDPVETEVPAPTESDAPVGTDVIDDTVAAQNAEEPTSETVFEVLDQIPEGTSLVVVNESGQLEPLATQNAAEAILIADPVWCPVGQAPTPGLNGCSGSFASLSDLVAGFIPTTNGTIWIQTGNDSGLAVTIDGSGGWAAARNYSLTLQGGWTGTSGDSSIGPNSVFDTSITIDNWNNTVTLNNLTFNSVGTSALKLNNDQDININNSIFTNNSNRGAWIDTANNVSISGSTFSGNGRYGVQMDTVNNASISNSTFSGNTDIGALVQIANDVSITGSTFSNNNSFGTLITNASGVTSISGSTFTGNVMYGASMYNVNDVTVSSSTFEAQNDIGLIIQVSNDINISGSTFSDNGDGDSYDDGLSIDHSHDVTVSGSTFSGNTGRGAYIVTANNVVITGSAFRNNESNGADIETTNSTSVVGSVFNNNSGEGAWFDNNNSVHITDSNFYNNNRDGLKVLNGDNATISNSSFFRNAFAGATITANHVSISNTTFSSNYILGLRTQNNDSVTISNSTFGGNDENGMYADTVNDISITGSTFSGNGYSGLAIDVAHNIFITDSTFNGNSLNVVPGWEFPGTYIAHVNDVTVINSTFNRNDIGLYLWDIHQATIDSSRFNDNADSGMSVDTFTGNIILNNNVFSGNYYGFDAQEMTGAGSLNAGYNTFESNKVAIWVETTSGGFPINLTLDCNQFQNNNQDLDLDENVTLIGILCSETPVEPPVIVIIVPADAESMEFDMECYKPELFRVLWANGDQTELACIQGAHVRISRIDSTELNTDLPAGFGYISAYKVEIFQNGVPVAVMPSDGTIRMLFAAKSEDIEYGIMFWSEETGNWVLLNDYQATTDGLSAVFPLDASDPRDAHQILKGVQHIEKQTPHREAVTTNFPGIFVLVQQ